MADNYLEKQMDDFRAGRLNSRHPSPMHRVPPLKPGEVALPGKRVLVACREFELTERLVRLFRSTGARVAFIAIPGGEGTALAQSTGSRFYPVPPAQESQQPDNEKIAAVISDLRHQWHGIDLTAGDMSITL